MSLKNKRNGEMEQKRNSGRSGPNAVREISGEKNDEQ